MERKLYILSNMSIILTPHYIQASDAAMNHLRKKLDFFRYRNRVPKILLAERKCSGAVFRLFFDSPAQGDIKVSVNEIDIYLQASLLQEYGGFSLDLEVFFFAHRLKVTPQRQSYQCDCNSKCNKAAKPVANEVI